MKKENVYSSKNVMSLVIIFLIIFWLLYALGSFLHESRKIRTEIEAIEAQNYARIQEIEEKKSQLDYLKTAERVDKEAKMQMGKKLPGEKVLVFIEEKLDVLPTEKMQKARVIQQDIPILEKWKWLFLHE
ncbi:MAG: hypothetical protein OEL89_01430 [Candidatus Peregrinibacteria bacterium]|nr:hypothetical protein [Candidatus Peregrinibacteria bacterium]